MPARKPPPSDEKPQYERFLEAAREHGTSEDPEVFERVFRKVMRVRPPQDGKQDRRAGASPNRKKGG